ncbi:hypothetical protein HJC99_04460 [Candidatus Saccharibacteria bacterium]|nr:hypothetical protein [Candidatus Saccharibacteria bacterium]
MLMADDEQSISKRPPIKLKPALLAPIVLIILAGLGSGTWLLYTRHSNPIPTSIRDASAYKLYYPTAEPASYTLDKSSIKQSAGTVSFSLKSGANKPTIVVTQQTLPPNFDAQAMFAHSSLPTTVSPIGTIYDLTFKTESRYLVVAPKSLIFLGSTPKMTNGELQTIINGLKLSQ